MCCALAQGTPAPDADGDGIVDARDTCPEQPEDMDGFQDEDGCPEVDVDHDGVPDLEDACPLMPGVKDERGCPRLPCRLPAD
jgi:hypothetical protein